MAIIEAGYAEPPLDGPDKLMRFGPTVHVNVGPAPPSAAREHVADIPLSPGATMGLRVPALVDTGARESCIDQSIADQLFLPLVDRRVVVGASGAETMNVYLAAIEIPGLTTLEGLFTAVKMLSGGGSHGVLLGRTMLKDMILVYDGRRGSVSLSK